MGIVVLYIAVSLDGYIADATGGVEWLETFEDTYEAGVPGPSFEKFFSRVDCMIWGANTYEQVLGFEEWPYRDTPAIVTTHREIPRVTDHVEFYAGNLEELVRDVTSTHDLVWLVGGAALARSFLAKNLIDEIQLSVIPILLGSGIALFSESGINQELHLTDEIAYENGIVELHYGIKDQ